MKRLFILIVSYFLMCASLYAEVTLDGTLGKSGGLSGPNYQIGADLGQQHGGNLFHSFGNFNLQSHESATFSGPDNVQNIIGRVTGGNPSNIDGTLRSTIPNADLYLLNPYGIIFGKNAHLDVQGGFHASTADYLRLQDGGRFEARYPNNSLLTVAPVAAFGFLTDTPAAITIQDSQLSIPKGKTFSLIGGDLRLTGSHPYTLDGTQLKFDASLGAPGGRINLASVASQGEVIPTDTDLSLSQVARRGAILAQNALISTSGTHGGSVFIRGGQFELTGSGVFSQTHGDQTGGPIDIQVDNLKVLQGSQISSGTLGTGNAGSVSIKTDTLEVSGKHESGSISAIDSISATENSGNAGQIEITARQVTLADDAQISSFTMGRGHAGAIILKVADNLTLTGGNIYAVSMGTMPQVGNGNNIEITARQIELTNGGGISAFTAGTGHGGSILLKGIDTLTVSGNLSEISADSGNKELTNAGNAGNVEIEARQITLTEGGIISSTTAGAGKAGKIVLRGVDTLVIGEQSFISAFSGSSGDAGQIDITARQIMLTNGGKIAVGTLGTGHGGSIVLNVTDSLTLTGSDKEGNRSTIMANTKGTMPQAGNGGSIEINARQIMVTNGGIITAYTFTGHGGSIVLNVTDSLTLTGSDKEGFPSSIITSSTRSGNAGSIEITARQITVTAGGQIVSGNFGTGQGGSIILTVADSLILTGSNTEGSSSNISTHSWGTKPQAGNGGSIEITARQITMTDGVLIDSDTFGTGQGGSVILKGIDTLTVSGKSRISANSDDKELANAGNAGTVEIEARQINLTENGLITSATLGAGKAGKIVLRGVDTLVIKQSYIASFSGYGSGDAGSVEIEARQVNLTASSGILSNTLGTGQGGKVVLRGVETLLINQSSINSLSGSGEENAGDAGDVEIEARQIILTNEGRINSSTSGTGRGGSILLTGIDTLTILGGDADSASGIFAGSVNTELANAGDAGNVEIEARQIVLTNGGKIDSSTLGTGRGGSILLTGIDTLTISGSDANLGKSGISAISGNRELANAGAAGNVEIKARQIVLTNGGQISTRADNAGGGDITLTTPNLLYLRNGEITTSVKGGMGNGGNITIEQPQFVVLNQGQIKAQADAGNGGNIRIVASYFITTPSSLVSASSNKGISGNVVISSPESDIGGGLLVLSKEFESILSFSDFCKPRTLEEKNSFRVTKHRQSQTNPADWQASPKPNR